MRFDLLFIAVPVALLATSVSAAPLDASTPSTITPRASGAERAPKLPQTAPSCPGIGVMLKNARKNKATYYFYNNLSNGDGTAEPQMDFGKPYNTIPLDSGEEKYVKLDTRFKGRIQRGNALGGTWAELQTQASNGGAHGDISLEQGCDGPATISSTCTDGKDCDTPVIGGFDWNVFVDANGKAAGDDVLWPAASVDGRKVLDTTMGNWDRTSPNQNTIRWLQGVLSQKYAYIEGGTGTDDIASANGCLAVTFYD